MQNQGYLSAIVLECQSCLDITNSYRLLEQVREAYLAGIRQIVVDMQHTNSISDHGFVALSRIISLLRQEPVRESKDTVQTMREMRYRYQLDKQAANLQIRNPQPHVAQALVSLGFHDVADIQMKRGM